MITKAIIVGKESVNKYLVRIPLFEGVGNSGSLEYSGQTVYPATLCYTPGTAESYLINDIVFVSFENNEFDNVIILGKLYLGGEEQSVGSASLNKLTVNGSTELNGTIKINGVDLSLINKHNQAIDNLSNITHDIQKEMPDITLNDWVIKENGVNLNFYRKDGND